MSEPKDKIKLFEEKQVRTVWDEKAEKWWFSVVDIVAVLTGSDNARRYWSDLKRKLKAEGSQLYENIVQLKMPSSDGKSYSTDVADTEQVLRLVQSMLKGKMSADGVGLTDLKSNNLIITHTTSIRHFVIVQERNNVISA